jgi:hypothetical protein
VVLNRLRQWLLQEALNRLLLLLLLLQQPMR